SLSFDVLVALAVLIADLVQLFGTDGSPSIPGVLLTTIVAVLLVWRRTAPRAVLAATLALEIAIPLFDDPSTGFAPSIALFTVAVMCDRWVSIAGLVPTTIAAFVLTYTGPASETGSIPRAIGSALLTIALWAVGAYVQTRRRYLRELRARAEYLEREREQLARIAVIEERTAIARELHDIVAHSVSVMLVAVRGARDVLHTSPDVADATLARVEASGEQSVGELRRILALLREPEQDAESRPQPSIAELKSLVADHRAGGLPVELEIVGEPRALPDGVELSVYRIVQEALTNVLKHSTPRRVNVTLAFRDSALEVEVLDDGAPAPASADNGGGHGIVGMRERVSLLGGQLETGRRPGAGFRVAAILPIEDPA
ncbi:MAG: sensor histidine kinase, partial [Chloroflexota bacterium]|nr:sensor histidine kinase [Chloroflexota bacterium]